MEANMSKRQSKPTEHEARILAGATGYVACIFRGRGKYERITTESLDEARAAARSLEKSGTGVQKALIYAVDAHGRQALVPEDWNVGGDAQIAEARTDP
jgi:hypothetical protein